MQASDLPSSPPKNPLFGQMYKPCMVFQQYTMPTATVLRKEARTKEQSNLSLPAITAGQKRLKTSKMQPEVTLDAIKQVSRKMDNRQRAADSTVIQKKKQASFGKAGTSLRG